jgi:hypothetical protein
MKPLKYTVGALALIAIASFTTSANAQTAANGDIMLGVYDTSGATPNSAEYNLGAFNSLSMNESWDLGSTISSSLSGGNASDFEFALFGTGGLGTNGADGLAKGQIALTNVIPSGIDVSGSTSSENLGISALFGPFNSAYSASALITGTSSSSQAFYGASVNVSSNGSFGYEDTGTGTFGTGVDLAQAYTNTATAELDVFKNGSDPTLAGTFVFSQAVNGDTILTFDPTATPEPSAYALGLCAVALFWVLKRRRSVA